MHLKIKQHLAAPTFSGEERGLPLHGVGAVRVVVYAPVGQTFNGEFDVRLALRHAATGLLLPLAAGDIVVPDGVAVGQRGVVVDEILVHGNEGDELVACVTGGTTAGLPLDSGDAGFIYLVLEPLPAR